MFVKLCEKPAGGGLPRRALPRADLARLRVPHGLSLPPVRGAAGMDIDSRPTQRGRECSRDFVRRSTAGWPVVARRRTPRHSAYEWFSGPGGHSCSPGRIPGRLGSRPWQATPSPAARSASSSSPGRSGATRGDWERLRTVWHDDGRMMATWFQGSADGFIEANQQGWARGVRILHFLGGSSIDVSGERAVSQTKMTISQRADVHGALCDVVCTGRFYDFFERRDGRWGLVLRQPIYEKDRLDPVDPSRPGGARSRAARALSRGLPASRLSPDAGRLRRQAGHAGSRRAGGRGPVRARSRLAAGCIGTAGGAQRRGRCYNGGHELAFHGPGRDVRAHAPARHDARVRQSGIDRDPVPDRLPRRPRVRARVCTRAPSSAWPAATRSARGGRPSSTCTPPPGSAMPSTRSSARATTGCRS